jgi:putative redox protein
MAETRTDEVTVVESGNGPYAQFVTAGRHVMGVDEPERLGGHDTGPSPYEYLLAALGACSAMTIRMYAARHEWPLRQVTVRLVHEALRGPDGAPIDRFVRRIALAGELTEQQRSRLLEIAERCPVSRTLRRPSEIVTELAANAPADAGDRGAAGVVSD